MADGIKPTESMGTRPLPRAPDYIKRNKANGAQFVHLSSSFLITVPTWPEDPAPAAMRSVLLN